ncbi:MAG: hypothetical protein J6U54_16800 [Clostridiales bacterium]|nr:hypothetical protein [Clostridiales bacterium]
MAKWIIATITSVLLGGLMLIWYGPVAGLLALIFVYWMVCLLAKIRDKIVGEK